MVPKQKYWTSPYQRINSIKMYNYWREIVKKHRYWFRFCVVDIQNVVAKLISFKYQSDTNIFYAQ